MGMTGSCNHRDLVGTIWVAYVIASHQDCWIHDFHRKLGIQPDYGRLFLTSAHFLFFSTEAGILGSSLLFSKAPILETMLMSVAWLCPVEHRCCLSWKSGGGGQAQMVHFLLTTYWWWIAILLKEGKELSYWAKKNNGPQGWSITIPTFLSDEKLIGPCHID